jgi:hypothetical protein
MFLTLVQGGCEWSASHPDHFSPEERVPLYPSDRRMGGPQSWSECSCEDKTFLHLSDKAIIICKGGLQYDTVNHVGGIYRLML